MKEGGRSVRKKCNNKLIKLIRRERIKKRKRERVG